MITLAVTHGFILLFGCVLAVMVWHIHRQQGSVVRSTGIVRAGHR